MEGLESLIGFLTDFISDFTCDTILLLLPWYEEKLAHFEMGWKKLTLQQGERSWQPFGEGKNGHKNQARFYYFCDKCVVFAHNSDLQI